VAAFFYKTLRVLFYLLLFIALISLGSKLDVDKRSEEFVSRNWKEAEPHLQSILLLFSILIFGLIYARITQPFHFINDPDSISKIPNGKLLARAVRSRKSGKIPPSFPTGWYKIEEKANLKVGDVRYVEFLGEHLVLFRGENTLPVLLDAYCPHLGANLAVEGKVVGNCIECPFHGWRFQDDGKCVHIPYLDKVPEIAKTRTWPVVERNEGIYMWFDALGRLEKQSWQIPEIEEIQSKKYIIHGSFINFVEAHIQEIPENGADVAHLGVLHVPFAMKCLPFITHKWSANWSAGEFPEDYVAHIELTQSLLFFGKLIPFTFVKTQIRQIGPGIVYLEIFTPFGKIIVVEHVTPLQPLFQKVSHTVFGPRGLLYQILAQTILSAFSEQFARDVVIWNNKTFISKPLVVKNDGNILGFRRW